MCKTAGRDKFIRLLNNAGRFGGQMSRRGSLAGSACMDFPLRGRTQVDNSLIVANDTGARALGAQTATHQGERSLLPPLDESVA